MVPFKAVAELPGIVAGLLRNLSQTPATFVNLTTRLVRDESVEPTCFSSKTSLSGLLPRSAYPSTTWHISCSSLRMERKPVVFCLCGHQFIRHVVGVCIVALCTCVREQEVPPKRAGPSDCQRCHRDGPAIYRVQTSGMDVTVCERCADAAAEMGLRVGE